ncbi:Sapep family Mn(2+)-dependent dipeptidase [Erwinia sp. SLM-02]|uniref:Sapep family Mn(2+)-dependent dipeptidase n=1 Tax=Erwinia sp. SLM-02 TaxID=3020057 RepID=UPI0028CFE1F1|nr:Sapep family Mn(2+)-dependent dipeptidase [uncultured Erwinia sp.]
MATANNHQLSQDELALTGKLERWFEQHREEFVQDLLELVAFPSIGDEKLAEPGKPFGQPVEDVFQHVIRKAQSYGFTTEQHDGYAISVLGDTRDGVPELGLISHLDVVPPGDNWTFEPFKPFEKDGFVIGRGSSDNKGPALLDLYLLRAFRDLGVPLHHKLRIVYGGAEEIGMADMKYFAEHGPVPRFSIITDGAFPVNHAQKGGLNLVLHIPVGSTLGGVNAGVAENAVPATATLTLPAGEAARLEQAIAALPEAQRQALSIAAVDRGVQLTARGQSGHAAFPENTRNAIPLLLDALIAARLLEGDDLTAARIISRLLADPWGISAGFAAEDAPTGRLTLNGGLLIPHNDGLNLHLDIRYPLATDKEALLATLREAIAPLNGTLSITSDASPIHVDKESELVKRLQHTYDTIAEVITEPYSMGGGTHARYLPNSITFGPGFRRIEGELFQGESVRTRPDFIPAGHGSPHGPDEFVVIENLRRAFKVYAVAIPRLDGWLEQGLIDDVR